jgi:hypothetical protein
MPKTRQGRNCVFSAGGLSRIWITNLHRVRMQAATTITQINWSRTRRDKRIVAYIIILKYDIAHQHF